MTGLMYSTGMFGTIPINQAKATLYYTFAANSGDNRAQLAVAYRHLSGIATVPNVKEAIKYYKETANKAFKYLFHNAPPAGRYLQLPSWIIPDENGGIYGEGASFTSSGPNAQHSLPVNIRTVKQAIEYFQYLAEDNIVYAHYALATLFHEGGKTYASDFKLAVSYARKGAAYLWKPDGSPTPTRSKLDEFTLKQGAHCAGFIGARYLNGQGVDQDFEQARKWFTRGIEFHDYISYNSLGFMYYHGVGVKKDINKGVAFLKKAAEQTYGPAHFNLGYAYYQRNHPGDALKAFKHFTLASQKRNFLAWYYKGIMLEQGFPGQVKSIESAVYYFKVVSETFEELYSPLKWAHDSYNKGDYGSAILGFLIASEEGYETAQVNLAYMLDEQRGYFDLNVIKTKIGAFSNRLWHKMEVSNLAPTRDFHREKTALVYWTRAARQMNVDAVVKMGDYYFKGIGTEKEDPAKAAVCYQAAADHFSSLAKWNLGWMHENGIGAEKSFHLAKRYYDLAAETNSEAFFPVQLALLKLRMRSFWNYLISDGALDKITGLKYSDGDESGSEKKSVTSFFEGLHVIWQYVVRSSTGTNDEEATSTTLNSGHDNNMNEEEFTMFTDDDLEEFDTIDSVSLAIVVVVVAVFVVFNRRRAQMQQQREQQELGRNAQPAPIVQNNQQ
ncbi:hypothetical protein D0Z00_001275 [Geotrichum galactomycetum]|uniref:Uncharacterized protein n=1 Tax=Geotrichum galactomycetum TaxID=27317 RepID=A0ACB6V7M1_9ASCO|nr:hypothetical protein D0Z00_001275 [Geotrichum candidum]